MSEILDTRDLQERLNELETLESELELANDDLLAAKDVLDEYEQSGSFVEDSDEHRRIMQDIADAEADVEDIEFDETELEELRELKEEVGGEWDYGVQLIPESEFEEHCKELCEDIGDIPRDMPSYIVIDWASTADNLRVDYSTTTFRGEDYLYRA